MSVLRLRDNVLKQAYLSKCNRITILRHGIAWPLVVVSMIIGWGVMFRSCTTKMFSFLRLWDILFPSPCILQHLHRFPPPSLAARAIVIAALPWPSPPPPSTVPSLLGPFSPRSLLHCPWFPRLSLAPSLAVSFLFAPTSLYHVLLTWLHFNVICLIL